MTCTICLPLNPQFIWLLLKPSHSALIFNSEQNSETWTFKIYLLFPPVLTRCLHINQGLIKATILAVSQTFLITCRPTSGGGLTFLGLFFISVTYKLTNTNRHVEMMDWLSSVLNQDPKLEVQTDYHKITCNSRLYNYYFTFLWTLTITLTQYTKA